ncbi:hypothetical protein [Candidatus Frankia nodulisporulans]|uniref:hypothetical protein n=1 Tax=Candidatus Frankia nodulisporulans TaxID=2060052 RepID=UPI0013D5CEE0|nr:hypothetical protein [Candidatus Frankia nodulisporulans]
MAHYTCPDCGIRSQDVPTQAEANQHLGTHQTYFCRPKPKTTQQPTTTPPAATSGRRR